MRLLIRRFLYVFVILTFFYFINPAGKASLAADDEIPGSSNDSGQEMRSADEDMTGDMQEYPSEYPTDKNIIEEEENPGPLVDEPENNKEETGPDIKADKEIELRPMTVRGARKRDRKPEIQSISRQTLTAQEMKEVPASFGDSVNALTSLPGVIRESGGIFGPLVIRGMDSMTNKYFIDDIPIMDPLHFGGLHSVINTNIIKDMDLYSSAFPAEFGSATSAVLNISTIDEVNEFGGYFDISLLSVSSLINTPIYRDSKGNPAFLQPEGEGEENAENAGYAIASGRYGYIGLAIKASELITGDDIPISPEYWDYQYKMKYRFNKVHSASMLLFGHKDFIRILINDDLLDEGEDPLFMNAKMKYDSLSHSQGLYFDSDFSRDFSNRLMYFSTLADIHFYYDFTAKGAASWAQDLGVHSRPWTFGLKDKTKIKWLEGHAELTTCAEYTLYYFTATGKTILPTEQDDLFDPGDEDSFISYKLDEKITNHMYGGYIENKFVYSGLTVLPGIRTDYLVRSGQATFDPRLTASYAFPSKTTLSAAGGHYSYFPQVNPWIFEENTDISALGDELKPEKAWHSVISVEQELGLYTLKIEGFNNYFYDQPEAYPHYESDGTYLPGLCTGKARAYGFEIMLRKDSRANENGLFGWMSYTYTRSKQKTGLPTEPGYDGVPENGVGDEFGDTWTTSDYEQRHNFKMIAGYRMNKHTFSGRFQYYSSFPYTPIVGSEEDMNYASIYPDKHRYVPVMGDRNSRHFPSYYSLDLRYSHKTNYTWGYVSWYIEVINVLMKEPVNAEDWNWTKPYSDGHNPKLSSEDSFTILPNFGVEVKF